MRKNKEKKKEAKIKQKPTIILKNVWLMIKTVTKYLPQYPFVMISEGVIWGLLNAASTLFTIELFNRLDRSDVTFSEIAILIGIMALFYIGAYIFDGWYWDYYNTTLFQKLQYNMQKDLYEKALSLDLECYDDPKFFNDYLFAMDQARDRAWEVTENIGKVINRAVALFAIMGVILSISPIIAAIIFVFCVLEIVIRQVSFKLGYKMQVEQVPMHRRASYVNRQFHLSDGAKEIRVSDASQNLTGIYDDVTKEILDSDIKYGKKLFPVDFLWNALDTLIPAVLMFVSFIFLSQGKLQLGGFAAAVTSTWNASWALSNLFERIQKFSEQSLYIEKYLTFLDRKPTIIGGDLIPGDFESLEFKDVSFSYPFGEKNEVLSNINFVVKRGEKVALVGYNGAGKTTFTKLVMRLYDVTKGEILYNGVNIKRLDLASYREKIGTVFQDFKIFSASIAENVMNGPYDPERDRERVQSALKKATFETELDKLPRGIDTPLTKEFYDEGVNLSGGEAQKVAIARIFVKDYGLIIMDEPSSALDPAAEYELNHTILSGAAQDDRTVIFISHRLSTTRMADKIYMFDMGRIIESGSHDELMAKEGKYAEMFTLQAKKYREKQDK